MVAGESIDSVRLSEQERRIVIKGAWIAAGKPNPATWVGCDGLAARIVKDSRRLFKGPVRAVTDVVIPTLRECAVADNAGRDYNGERRAGSGGHNKKMRAEDWATDDALAAGEAVWPTMRSERIIEDFDRWPTSIQGIVDLDGVVFEPKKASGQRKQRALLGPLSPSAAAAEAKSYERFG